MKPKISIVIPVSNAERTLGKTLLSLKKQTFKNYEIIIVDDASEDNSYNIAKKYTKNIIKNKKRLGPAKTRNKGIKKAKAGILAFIDSDCIATPTWLENIYTFFKKNKTKVVMGCTRIPQSTFLGDSISALGFPGGANAGFEKVWIVSKEGYTDHITSCNFAIKKEIFKKYGYFNESFPYPGGEDPELSHRLTKNNIKIKYSPNIKVYHEPRKNLLSFIKWQIKRGRTNYHFQKKVGKISNFIKLRIWYAKNIIKNNILDLKIILVFPLLILSFILQQLGYILERLNLK